MADSGGWNRALKFARILMWKGWAFTLQSTVVMPYAGTRLYEVALEKGWLRYSPGEWERWDMGALGSRFKFISANCLIGIFGGRR